MKNILILSPDSISLFDIERSAEELGLRVKLCTEIAAANYWLSSRTFDLMLVHEKYSLNQIQELCQTLWSKNRGARLCVLQEEKNRSDDFADQVHLIGGRVISLSDRSSWITLFKTLRSEVKSDPDLQILVVEDLLSPRDIICVFIESLGFKDVHGVGSVKEALKLLENDPKRFNCIVTDIRMPEIGGKEFIEVLRKNKKLEGLPVVVLTAYGTADTLLDCLKVGASGFLVKPPKKADLVRELARAVRINRGEEAPRMASVDEVDRLHELLGAKGIV